MNNNTSPIFIYMLHIHGTPGTNIDHLDQSHNPTLLGARKSGSREN